MKCIHSACRSLKENDQSGNVIVESDRPSGGLTLAAVMNGIGSHKSSPEGATRKWWQLPYVEKVPSHRQDAFRNLSGGLFDRRKRRARRLPLTPGPLFSF